MPTLIQELSELLKDPQDVTLAKSIFGTAEAREIAAAIEAHVRRPIVRCLLVTQSVAAVVALELETSERVVLKIHGPNESRWGSPAGSSSVYEVMESLRRQGIPFAELKVPPQPFANGGTIVELGWLDPGQSGDPLLPENFGAMAKTMREIIERARPLAGLSVEEPQPLLRRRNRVRSVQASAAIEGNALSIDQQGESAGGAWHPHGRPPGSIPAPGGPRGR